jgi:hypothetical protein
VRNLDATRLRLRFCQISWDLASFGKPDEKELTFNRKTQLKKTLAPGQPKVFIVYQPQVVDVINIVVK